MLYACQAKRIKQQNLLKKGQSQGPQCTFFCPVSQFLIAIIFGPRSSSFSKRPNPHPTPRQMALTGSFFVSFSMEALPGKTRLCRCPTTIVWAIFGVSASTVSYRCCCFCQTTAEEKSWARQGATDARWPVLFPFFTHHGVHICVLTWFFKSPVSQGFCCFGLLAPQCHALLCQVDAGNCSYLFSHFLVQLTHSLIYAVCIYIFFWLTFHICPRCTICFFVSLYFNDVCMGLGLIVSKR